MPIDFQKTMIKKVLSMVPASTMEKIPELIEEAIIGKMNSVVLFPGEQTSIQIDQVDGELVILLIVINEEGDYVRTEERMKAKDFIKKLISTANGNQQGI